MDDESLQPVLALVEVWESETPKNWTVTSKIRCQELIDLKAELFKKQEEFKRQKLQSQNAAYIKGKSSVSEKKRPNIWSKKNAGVSQRAAKDYEKKLEEEDIFARSKKSLENKAKLYEKISSGSEVPDEDGSGLYLVDFQKKVIDGVFEERDRARQEEEERQRREIEEEKQQLQEPVPEAENEEEEWVDFVDSLGRSRRCLKKDLPDIQRQDNVLKDRQDKKQEKMAALAKDFEKLRDKSSGTQLLSDDMRRELGRQEWEQRELETMEAEKAGPVHYSNVRHNEIRSHGVGFYEFDKDETVRLEQMSELNKLREQTMTERSKKDRIKEKRKAALEARLAKVKQRRKMKTGDQEPEESEPKSNEEIGPKIEEKSEGTTDDLAEVTETEKKPSTKVREWDIGKERLLERSEANWLEKQRAERDEEFAPPKEYFDDPRQLHQNPRHHQRTERHQEFAPPKDYHDNLRQQQESWRGNKSVFSKIRQIKLKTFGEKSEENSEQDSGNTPTDNVPFRHESGNFDQRVGPTSVINEQQALKTGTEEQNSSFPLGFDTSIPPPTFIQQQQPPSWLPQQQTGTSFSAPQTFTGSKNQSTGSAHLQNQTFPNSNPIVTGPGGIHGATQNFQEGQTATNSAKLYMGGLPIVTHPGVPVTHTQPVSGTNFSQYTNTLPSNGNYGNPGVNASGYSQVQPVANTQPKTVIPKMKILDTRLMQNEDD